MPRHRSISHYAQTEKEYLEKCQENPNEKGKTLFKRRRRYKTSFSSKDIEYHDEKNENTEKIINKKFSSYDDLEFDELGINSTYQIQNIENENDDDTEIELLNKINNINLSFKEKDKENFIFNLIACSKNIINDLPNEFIKSNNSILNEKKYKYINPFYLENDNNNYLNSDNHIESKINDIENDFNKNIESESEKNIEEIDINKSSPYSSTINSSISGSSIQKDINYKDDEKKSERSYTFEESKNSQWYNCSIGNEEKINSIQNKKIQDYIQRNKFLSKNIDYVDEHLKLLVCGSDIRTKNLLINEMLNKNNRSKEKIYEFNIYKKVIKILGDYIKLELLVEDCNLCYSLMLNSYVSVVNGLILTIDINDASSAKYVYELLEKIKYKLNLNRKHFSVICIYFDFIDINSNKENVSYNKNIISKIENEFNIKTFLISYSLNNIDENDNKLENIINKYLSLAYLKKERKNIENKKIDKNRKKSTID